MASQLCIQRAQERDEVGVEGIEPGMQLDDVQALPIGG